MVISISVRNPIQDLLHIQTHLFVLFIQIFPLSLSLTETIFVWLLQKQTPLISLSGLTQHHLPPCDVKPRPLSLVSVGRRAVALSPPIHHTSSQSLLLHLFRCTLSLPPSCSGLPSWSSVFLLLLPSFPDAAGFAGWVNCLCSCALPLLPAQPPLLDLSLLHSTAAALLGRFPCTLF